MDIKTSQAINGFIASEPKLTYGDDGRARFYARIGMNHFERREDGSFKELEPTFHDLIQFGKAAERSADLFVKGDQFIAQGRVNDFTREVDGQPQTDEQFLASRVGHDGTTTRYDVQRRSPEAVRNSPEHGARARDQTSRQGAASNPAGLGPAEPLSHDQAPPTPLVSR
ncbi:MAG: single-stranded DNA-binding protein [Aeromicrobium sp.]|nr:single-stranded DNA-binding protein [Aeromicrobium sp.]